MKLSHSALVNDMISKGYISVRKHPQFDLYIYNYTQKASAEHVWNEATEECRGIICDKEQNVIALPFAKFYNYEELLQQGIKVPDLPFEVYEKLDGSLGILYFYEGKPYIATRGSFDSYQAKHATEILYSKYADKLHLLDESKTYLFEIIIPHGVDSNLVVDYGDVDDIFLLAVIDNESGKEYSIENFSHIFKCAQKYNDVKDYLKFRKDSNGSNREGFIIKFQNGFRMKLKFAEYFKAHSLKSHLSIKSILLAISENRVSMLRKKVEENLSEEDAIYFDELLKDLYAKFDSILEQCVGDLRKDFHSRAEAAEYFKGCKYPKIMFALYDGRNVSKLLWDAVAKDI